MSHAVRHLDLFVTEACNLACPYCFARNRQGAAHMPLQRAKEAVRWLCGSTSEKVHVTFWGGEPLLRLPWLEDVAQTFIEEAKRTGKKPSMSLPTNATLLNDAALQWIRRFEVRTFLSIDGDAETQVGRPLASGGSSHPLAERGLRALLAQRTSRPTTVRMTVTPENVRHLPHNVRYFSERGVRRLMIYPAYDQPWSEGDVRAFADAENSTAAWLVDRLATAEDARRVVRLEAWVPVLRGLAGSRSSKTPDQPISPCGAGVELVALNVDDTFTPCHRFTFYGRTTGNVRRLGDFVRGLDPSAAQSLGNLRWERQRGVSQCTDCDLFSLCSMGCIAINYAATGDLTQVPPWACALQRARIDACRTVHQALQTHPAYAGYLGQPPGSVLRRQADELGRRAARLWQSMSEPRNESWQSSI